MTDQIDETIDAYNEHALEIQEDPQSFFDVMRYQLDADEECALIAVTVSPEARTASAPPENYCCNYRQP
jgi:hypothetical protein